MQITLWGCLCWCVLSACVGFVFGRLWIDLKRFAMAVQDPSRKACQVFCPCCLVDLASGPSVCWDGRDGLVYYTCECGVKSRWDFDSPVPVLVDVSRSV